MSEPRLKTEIWVSAHIRTCFAQGAMAVVARKGDVDAGNVAIKVFIERDRAVLFIRSRDLDGHLIWHNPFEEEKLKMDNDNPGYVDGEASEEKIDRWLAKEASIDRDLWVIEIEDRLGRSFLDL